VARPSVVSGELERLESLIEVITVPETEGDKPPVIPGHALLVFTSNAVIPLAKDADVSKHLKAGNRIATLHRSRGFLRRALDEGAFVEPEADDLESLYQALVERAALLVPQLSVKETMEDLYAQQKAFPAFLGHGIAVPHVYSSQVPERICIFAKLEKPLPFMGQDEQIRIVFFIISPSGDSEGHLATLAEIARTCQQQENIASLESAETLNDVLRVV
jgi:PTS system nitrogen regulatory IIA component